MTNNYLCFIQFYVQLTYLLTILISEHLILKLDLNFQLFILRLTLEWYQNDEFQTLFQLWRNIWIYIMLQIIKTLSNLLSEIKLNAEKKRILICLNNSKTRRQLRTATRMARERFKLYLHLLENCGPCWITKL